MTKYGYARVSTKGQSLNDQVSQILNQGVRRKDIFHEKFTGTTTQRPQFKKLMQTVNTNDEVVITKLDRFARNITEALEAIDKLQSIGVKIYVINLGLLEDTTIGKLTRNILLSVAEMERDLIVDRTQAGKAYAKQHNPRYREGRPISTKQSRVKGISYKVIYEYTKNNSVRKTADRFGVAPSTVSKIKRICSK